MALSSTGSGITRCEFLLFYFLIFKTISSCGCLTHHLWPVASGSAGAQTGEGTALTASDAAGVSPEEGLTGALVRLPVKPVPGGCLQVEQGQGPAWRRAVGEGR